MPSHHWITDYPVVFLGLLLLPVAVVAWSWRIFPTGRVIWPLAATAAMSFLVALEIGFLPVLIVLDSAILALLIFDLSSMIGRSQIIVERQVQRVASVGVHHPVTLHIENHSKRTLRLEVRDDCPNEFSMTPQSHSFLLHPGQRAEAMHKLRATKRGSFQLDFVDLRRVSRLGFWCRYIRKPVQSTIHVYPDMQQMSKYSLLARTNRLSLMGVRRTRKVGQDNNFERLRDYMLDDNYRHIDWRSTARRQKLTVKQFQTDQRQRVIFLLDCGRMMTNQYQKLSLLDYALNSVLMLSYVALKQGDSVGLLSFSDEIHEFVPLRSGPSQMNRLLHAGFNRFPKVSQSRFDQAFLYLSTRCRRRSLVVLVTNFVDELSASQVASYMSNLGGQHLPLVALLRDHRLFDAADHPHAEDEVLYRSAAAAQILTWRHDVLRRLSRAGVLTVDAFPEDLTSPLINRYLEVKAKHLL